MVVRKPNRPALFNSPLDTLFNEFFTTPEVPASRVKSRPAINLIETADNYRLEVAAPGLTKSDFHLNVEDDVLSLKVSKETGKADNETVVRQGFSYHDFERTFRLGDAIDSNGIGASYEQGVLTITLPKKEEAKAQPARTIEIS
jgi:HSP20 family protein